MADSLPTTEKIPLAEEVLELTLAEIVTEFGQVASETSGRRVIWASGAARLSGDVS